MLVLAVLAIASTPLVWLLDNPDAGQLVGASIQGATGIAALVWVLIPPSATLGTKAPDAQPTDTARETGKARTSGGGRAVTGVRRPGGADSGSATAEHTGDAIANGPGSSATTGIDYTT